MLNGLDLFSGIGGLTVGLAEWVQPVAYCENDRYAQGVLLSRMWHEEIPIAPIWDDVRTLKGKPWRGDIDIIYGGFPCQNISVAGDGKGLAGKRSGLFFEIMRLVDEIQPAWVFLENVPAITTRGLGEVSAEITKRGYDSRWQTVSAAEVGAPHLRKRWFLLAHTVRKGLQGQRKIPCGTKKKHQDVSNTCWWEAEPNMDRVANGVSNRVDRIKCLGNAVVPTQASKAFKELIGIIN